jgi:hypothetical protein
VDVDVDEPRTNTERNETEGGDAQADRITSELKTALEAGASVMFTCSGVGCRVTITYQEMTFTGHGENTATALDRALAALTER